MLTGQASIQGEYYTADLESYYGLVQLAAEDDKIWREEAVTAEVCAQILSVKVANVLKSPSGLEKD